MSFLKKLFLLILIVSIGYLIYLGVINVDWSSAKFPNTTIDTSKLPVQKTTNESTIKIANWNLQIFGDTKASNQNLLNFYLNVIKNYDVVFIQEIRDADGSSFDMLCAKLPEYNCQISSRAGRTSSKEQYGVITKKGITANLKDYNPSPFDRWERPPIEVDLPQYNISIYNIHTKPEDVKNELKNLEDLINTNSNDYPNTIILGDLNADCNYYTNDMQIFSDYIWDIKDNEDTTVGSTDCAYDRIIMSNSLGGRYMGSGIFRNSITSEVSDHYLIWVELKQ